MALLFAGNAPAVVGQGAGSQIELGYEQRLLHYRELLVFLFIGLNLQRGHRVTR
jgi:hypothetical protein